MDIRIPWCLTFAAIFLAVLFPDLADAGSIGWAEMGDDASSSMMGAAHSAVPLLVGATLVSSAFHLGGLATNLTATSLAGYGAANADQVQGIMGAGGAGGSIVEILAMIPV